MESRRTSQPIHVYSPENYIFVIFVYVKNNAPPSSDLQILLELAQEGRLQKLSKIAAQIGEKDERYEPFIKQVLQLSKQFQSEKIEQLIQQFLTVN